MVSNRSDRYRSLAAKLGQDPARALIDRLQVLVLTQPDAFREMEQYLESVFRMLSKMIENLDANKRMGNGK